MVDSTTEGGSTLRMALVLALASGVALSLLTAMMAIAVARHRRQLGALHRLAEDGLLGRARRLVPQPVAGSDFEALVDALDDGQQDVGLAAFRRLQRRVGRFHLTGWALVSPAAALLSALPLLPALAATARGALASAFSAGETWQAWSAGLLMFAALLPLALLARTLARHLHDGEQARRASAAAALIHHGGKELR